MPNWLEWIRDVEEMRDHLKGSALVKLFGQGPTLALAEATSGFNTKRRSVSSHEASLNAGSVNDSKGRDPDFNISTCEDAGLEVRVLSHARI